MLNFEVGLNPGGRERFQNALVSGHPRDFFDS